MSNPRDGVHATADALQERPPEATRDYYSQWAEYYDSVLSLSRFVTRHNHFCTRQDVVDARYNGPACFMQGFLPLRVDKHVRILDVGAGER